MERTVEERDFFLWYEREGHHLEFEHDPDIRSPESLDDIFCDSYSELQFVVGVKDEAHYCTDCWDDLGMDSQQQLGDYTATPVYALVGCGSAKRDGPAPAHDLYTSPYFENKRRFAEAFADQWCVLSAEYGLVHSDEELEPYDTTIEGVDIDEWLAEVSDDIGSALDSRE